PVNWKVRAWKVGVGAGVLATAEASPMADAEPAMARPWALTLFSRSSKDEPWAAPAAAMPAMARASADSMCLRGWVFILSLRWSCVVSCVLQRRRALYRTAACGHAKCDTDPQPRRLNRYRGASAPLHCHACS